ncbi:MAG TPA: hypothetical protein EYN75_02565 [Candidatus Nitrosopelagicus sp.]|jgi:hypothetical protein|nr:hypothetical protein [Candidatus Nitrosopelagicus sp.]HIO85212.1 hypothetical protein [Candidatus Nitrosopelagicus sp.]
MKAILLLALSAIMLSQSYGFADAVHLNAHVGLDVTVVDPITIETDSSSYKTGDMINVSGSVSDYDESDPFKNFDVTLKVIAPNNNIINISQLPLNSDGSYSTFILAQGPLWKFDGDYTISVSHGSDNNASATFTFISEHEEVIEEVIEVMEEVIDISDEELAKGCGEGTYFEDGVCVLGETESVSTGSSPTVGGNALIYSITFTVLIAFIIMIIFYLISRASRTKTV